MLGIAARVLFQQMCLWVPGSTLRLAPGMGEARF